MLILYISYPFGDNRLGFKSYHSHSLCYFIQISYYNKLSSPTIIMTRYIYFLICSSFNFSKSEKLDHIVVINSCLPTCTPVYGFQYVYQTEFYYLIRRIV